MSNTLCSAFSTLAIATVAVGAFTSPLFVSVAHANNGLTVSAVPNSGTLTPGQSLEIRLTDPSGTTDAVSDSCLVNNVDVNSTFHNAGPGDYRYTYTVGAGDQSRAAGTIPVNCTIHQAVSVSVTAFDDNNTVAIDTSSNTGGNDGGDNGGNNGGTGTSTAVAPELSMTSLSPHDGQLVAGNTVTATFTEAHSQSDLTLTGSCLLNAKDVSSSWHSTGGGQYIATYTIQAGDGERPAGHLPISCTMGNSAGNVTAHAWLDGNTVSIDTNGDGTIDNGTSTLGFTVSANPSTGTLHAGDSVTIDLQDPLPSGDVVADFCRVNDVETKSTYQYVGNGLYRVTYTAQAGDAIRAAGYIPFDCTLHNATGSVHLVSFTDGNSLAVDPTTSGSTGGDNGGDNGGTTGGDTGTSTATTTLSFTVGAVPNTGTLTAGNELEIYIRETARHDQKIVLDGACTVNGTDVSSSFQNLTDGLYKLIYHVGTNDTARAAGTIPFSCSVKDWHTNETALLSAFTDANTVAIGTSGGSGDNGATTGGTIGGDVTGGNNGGNGTTTNGFLHVDSIEQVRDTATAGAGFGSGWAWKFRITVPTNEPSLAMKFADWTHSNGTDHIGAANNMRISSNQAATTTTISITGAGTYSDAMTVTGDLDPNTPGRQIEVMVEMQVPSDTLNGSYTTDYGVKSY